MQADVRVSQEAWLDEVAGQLAKPDVGVVGAWQQFPDHTTHSAGIVLADGCAGWMHAFHGLPASDIGHMGRAHLTQRYLAVARECLATPRALFESMGGLDAKRYPNHLWNVDYCLRVRMDAGKATVWTPYARLELLDTLTLPAGEAAEQQHLHEQWGALVPVDPYFNPNLDASDPRFFLSWPPRLVGTLGSV
jgi:O-antigen biosynthesis protein